MRISSELDVPGTQTLCENNMRRRLQDQMGLQTDITEGLVLTTYSYLLVEVTQVPIRPSFLLGVEVEIQLCSMR